MILVTGCTGFLGKRVCKLLESKKINYLGTSKIKGLDLRNRNETLDFFNENKPTKIINCAAYVGGIQFGLRHQAEIFHNNLQITINLLEASNKFGVQRIVNPISNCAYPGTATFFKEDEFWDGPLHQSVMVYGLVRKISWLGSYAYAQQYGLDVINLILSNMYGPEDHFDEERSHALGALIMKIVNAKFQNKKEVIIWGSGKPVREWIHVDDAAEAMVRALEVDKYIEPINIGVGKGISILEMANLIRDIVDFKGELILDLSKLDGAPFKTVDGSRGLKHFGWLPKRNFKSGIEETIEWYIKNGVKNG